VQYSALDACREGFNVFVIEDAIRGIDVAGSVEKAWNTMVDAGVRRIRAHDLSGKIDRGAH
jgi:nicotinamidase/pyrazinamidase